jgi:hypothetical protein
MLTWRGDRNHGDTATSSVSHDHPEEPSQVPGAGMIAGGTGIRGSPREMRGNPMGEKGLCRGLFLLRLHVPGHHDDVTYSVQDTVECFECSGSGAQTHMPGPRAWASVGFQSGQLSRSETPSSSGFQRYKFLRWRPAFPTVYQIRYPSPGLGKGVLSLEFRCRNGRQGRVIQLR